MFITLIWVERAVDYCVGKGILEDFLSKNRAEAIAMSIFEYDEEKHIRNEREIAREEGREEGENRAVKLMQKLIEDGRDENLKRVLIDREYREQLYQEYGLQKSWED